MSISLLLQANSREAVAFGFVLCRMWQFQAGMLVFFAIAKNEKSSDFNKIKDYNIKTMPLLTETEKDDEKEEIKINLDEKKVFFNLKKNSIPLKLLIVFAKKN